jgi:hypothetical protein
MQTAVHPYDWARLLEACAEGMLAAHLAAHPLAAGPLAHVARGPLPGEPYGRLPVHRDERGEVLLVSWGEDEFCAPHDHGSSGGVIQLMRGVFVERVWRFAAGALVVVGERRVAAPSLVRVAPGVIHDMKAQGRGLGVHLYLPAIADMHVHDLSRRETLTVTDECGAWIPREERLITGRTPWP